MLFAEQNRARRVNSICTGKFDLTLTALFHVKQSMKGQLDLQRRLLALIE